MSWYARGWNFVWVNDDYDVVAVMYEKYKKIFALFTISIFSSSWSHHFINFTYVLNLGLLINCCVLFSDLSSQSEAASLPSLHNIEQKNGTNAQR